MISAIAIVDVAMRLPWGASLENDFDGTLNHAPRREQCFGRPLEPVRSPAHHDDFEASLVVEVDVHARSDLVAKLVLHSSEAFGQLADVVIVDEGHARESFDALARERTNDLGARKISK